MQARERCVPTMRCAGEDACWGDVSEEAFLDREGRHGSTLVKCLLVHLSSMYLYSLIY